VSAIKAALPVPSERNRVKAQRGTLLLRERVLRDKAEAASRSKDELLATVAHELRSPTNAIVMWAHLLGSGSLDQNTTQRALEGIDRSARLQTLLIDDLLDVSRIVTGKFALHLRPVDLRLVVEDAVEVARPAAESKQIRFEADLFHSPVMVAGDINRLQQVFANVLSNAIKFTPAAGRVAMRLRTEADRAVVTVTDNGCGISSAFLSHVFEPFRQASASTTRAHGGLGLGLAIVHQLLAQHGGSVTAESAGEGQGATFIVTLPALATRGTGVGSPT
jgi:signal transduction histidine kinase